MGTSADSTSRLFLFWFDAPAAAEAILKGLATSRQFSASFVMEERQYQQGELAIGLLAFNEPVLNRAAILRFSRASSTGKRLVKFLKVRDFPSIRMASLQRQVPDIDRHYTVSSTERLNGIAAGMQAALEQNLPSEAVEVLAALEVDRRNLGMEFSAPEFREAAAEKDAAMLLTRAVLIDPESAPTWLPPSKNMPMTYIDQAARNNEHHLVTKDLNRLAGLFPEWVRDDSLVKGFQIVDEKKGEKLLIVDVGGEQVELDLGIDVYFYNYRFDAYVLIQYKVLEGRGKDLRYRKDGHIVQQLKKMRDARSRMGNDVISWDDASGYRLGHEPFFIRFCERITMRPGSTDMLDGFFMPAGLCERVLADRSSITAEDRHLSNTSFVELLHHGWIGSTDRGSRTIKGLIDDAEERGARKKVIVSAFVGNEGNTSEKGLYAPVSVSSQRSRR